MFARNSFYTLGSSVVPLLVTITTLPLLLELIGAERYGALAVCWLILIYAGQADWGLGRALTHSVANARGEDASVTRGLMASGIATAAMVGGVMAVLASLVSWVFFAFFFEVNEELRSELIASVWLVGAGAWATSLVQVCYGALIGEERFGAASLSVMTSNAGLPLTAVLAAMFFSPDMTVLLVGALLSRCAGLAIAFLAIWRTHQRGHRVGLDGGYSKKLLTFGFWIMIVAFTAPVLVTIDRMMIGAQLGAVALAAYTIPYQVISRLQLIPQSVANVILPRMSIAKGDDARELALNYTVIVAGLFAPIVVGLIFLIEPLLLFWLGENLDPRSAPIGMYLLSAFLLTVIAQSASIFLQSQNAGRFVASFQLAEIVPYSILLFAAAEAYGLLGIGLAFLLRRTLEALVFIAKSKFGSWRFWVSQLPAITGIGASLALHNIFESLLAKLAMGSLIALAVLMAAALFAPSGTKALMRNYISKYFRSA